MTPVRGCRLIKFTQEAGGTVWLRIELRNPMQAITHDEVLSEFEVANFVREVCRDAGLPAPWRS
jgi:hypothetical protein